MSSPVLPGNLEEGTLISGRYLVCNKLGTGGMGIVYRVKDKELDDQVIALKILHAHLSNDEKIFGRFRNEVIVARTLSHPNIIRLYDIGKAKEGFRYISMEYVDGSTLQDKLKFPASSKNMLPLQESLWIFCEICRGVAYAHERGVVHRDLKPANIMISLSGQVKLADFGTSRIVGMDSSLTQTGQSIGTPHYMSPEQIRGESPKPLCDIYSLGVIAFELIAKKKPFPADSPLAVAYKHLNSPLPNIVNSELGIEPWCQEFIEKAMAKEKESRFQSVEEMLESLRPRLWSKVSESSPSIRHFSQTKPVIKDSKTPSNTQSSVLEVDDSNWTIPTKEELQVVVEEEIEDPTKKWSLDHLEEGGEEFSIDKIINIASKKKRKRSPLSLIIPIFIISSIIGLLVSNPGFREKLFLSFAKVGDDIFGSQQNGDIKETSNISIDSNSLNIQEIEDLKPEDKLPLGSGSKEKINKAVSEIVNEKNVKSSDNTLKNKDQLALSSSGTNKSVQIKSKTTTELATSQKNFSSRGEAQKENLTIVGQVQANSSKTKGQSEELAKNLLTEKSNNSNRLTSPELDELLNYLPDELETNESADFPRAPQNNDFINGEQENITPRKSFLELASSSRDPNNVRPTTEPGKIKHETGSNSSSRGNNIMTEPARVPFPLSSSVALMGGKLKEGVSVFNEMNLKVSSVVATLKYKSKEDAKLAASLNFRFRVKSLSTNQLISEISGLAVSQSQNIVTVTSSLNKLAEGKNSDGEYRVELTSNSKYLKSGLFLLQSIPKEPLVEPFLKPIETKIINKPPVF